ncbi:MAG TPA: helix-turn-helix transcriptional regulator [Gaiellaceae bacterium]|nr:helix-turn-helix transcriptional regulator [Gaiellaceae bacterium]
MAAAARRRQRRRGEARDAAAQALELFEQIGAPLWADKARIELERLGGRAAAGAALTATEERVASLAGEGRSTKEIAAELVVSPKTVEKHLTSIYAKLGVRSRAELAARTQRL